MLIWIIFIGFILLGIIDLNLRKRFKIEKNEKFMDQYINRSHFILELWMAVVFLIFISFTKIAGIKLYVLLFLLFALVFAIRAFLEYVFKKQSKRHYISLTYTFIGLFIALFILFFG